MGKKKWCEKEIRTIKLYEYSRRIEKICTFKFTCRYPDEFRNDARNDVSAGFFHDRKRQQILSFFSNVSKQIYLLKWYTLNNSLINNYLVNVNPPIKNISYIHHHRIPACHVLWICQFPNLFLQYPEHSHYFYIVK